jgi:exosortase E/protease (VPEID-CTERM system)
MWAYAAGAALAAVLMTTGWRALWQPASLVTYQMVQLMLRPLIGQLVVEPDRLRIATGRFGVLISPECSGMEGIGLLLLFGGVWLWLCRRECRFPQALLLLPVGLVVLFVLNSARIAALVLIGHAGWQQIAVQGFHTQAGWIAFNGVAFGLCVVAGRIPWLTNDRPERVVNPATVNKVAVYIGPFLAILAGTMLARAMTGGFEWMYPLHVAAPCVVFWMYRHEYRKMDWQFTWTGPAVGLLAFAMWIGLEWAIGGSPSGAVPGALQSASGAARWGWISVRLFGSVMVVPVAEELAFRGFVLRRLMTEEFDRLAPARFTIWALAASSVLFGAMHGGRWLAGTAAGLLYALAYMRKGRLADAVIAHVVTNGLIAASVLGLGWWKLW